MHERSVPSHLFFAGQDVLDVSDVPFFEPGQLFLDEEQVADVRLDANAEVARLLAGFIALAFARIAGGDGGIGVALRDLHLVSRAAILGAACVQDHRGQQDRQIQNLVDQICGNGSPHLVSLFFDFEAEPNDVTDADEQLEIDAVVRVEHFPFDGQNEIVRIKPPLILGLEQVAGLQGRDEGLEVV